MRCPSCGEILESNFQFCGNCGASIPEADAPVIAVVTPRSQEPSSLADESAAHPVAAPPPVAPAEPAPAPVHKLVATGGLLSGRSFTIGPQGLLIGRVGQYAPYFASAFFFVGMVILLTAIGPMVSMRSGRYSPPMRNSCTPDALSSSANRALLARIVISCIRFT